jgi:hypothetical protein
MRKPELLGRDHLPVLWIIGAIMGPADSGGGPCCRATW